MTPCVDDDGGGGEDFDAVGGKSIDDAGGRAFDDAGGKSEVANRTCARPTEETSIRPNETKVSLRI
jgi:hypothetical protein